MSATSRTSKTSVSSISTRNSLNSFKRLSSNVIPKKYELTIWPKFEAEAFSGSVLIPLEAR